MPRRLTLLRPRLRTLMALVGLVAVVIGVDGMRRRRDLHLARAAEFGDLEGKCADIIGRELPRAESQRRRVAEGEAKILDMKEARYSVLREMYRSMVEDRRWQAAHYERGLDDYRRKQADFRRLRRHHEYAASRPWLRIEAEPADEASHPTNR